MFKSINSMFDFGRYRTAIMSSIVVATYWKIDDSISNVKKIKDICSTFVLILDYYLILEVIYESSPIDLVYNYFSKSSTKK